MNWWIVIARTSQGAGISLLASVIYGALLNQIDIYIYRFLFITMQAILYIIGGVILEEVHED